MKHTRSSINGIFILETQGNPNLRTEPLKTDFNEDISVGSLCVDKSTATPYILSTGNVWKTLGGSIEAYLVDSTTGGDVVTPDYESAFYGAVINSPNSTIQQDTKNAIILGGRDIIASSDNTAYFNQIGLYSGTDGFEGILLKNDLTDNRIWQMPDKSGTVALLSDITGSTSGGGYLPIGGTSALYTLALSDKNLEAVDASTDGSVASFTPLSSDPITESYVTVFVNGQEQTVGDGVKTEAFYFSSDGGLTAKGFSHENPNGKVSVGDFLFFNPSIAGFSLMAGWKISVHYLKYTDIALTEGGISTNGDTYVSNFMVYTAKAVSDFTNTKEFISKEYADRSGMLFSQNCSSGITLLSEEVVRGWELSSVVVETGGSSADVFIGSASGTDDIMTIQNIPSASAVKCTVDKGFFSLTSETPIFVSSTADMKIYLRFVKIAE